MTLKAIPTEIIISVSLTGAIALVSIGQMAFNPTELWGQGFTEPRGRTPTQQSLEVGTAALVGSELKRIIFEL